jgi:hypothetical protein
MFDPYLSTILITKSMKDKNDFLIEEYNAAVKLTYHIDELRNKLTSFFLIFAGLSSTMISLFLEGKILNNEIDQFNSLSFILFFISIIGLIIILILGKLRRVQFEHFNIINNIREYFLHEMPDYKSITILNKDTLPVESYTSGSYLWTLIISLTSSLILASSIYFLFFISSSFFSIFIPVVAGILFFILLNYLYKRMTNYKYQNYSYGTQVNDTI